MATEKVKVIKIDTEPGAKSVKELRNRLKELKDVLVQTEEGTEEYSEAMKEAADISHSLRDMQEELSASAMDFGQVANNCTNVIKGMVGGLQSAQAIMTLFGAESEDVVKAMQKMQASMAIIQGITAMESGFKSLNRLLLRYTSSAKSATIATKVLSKAMQPKVMIAISAAIAGVVYAYNKLTDATRKTKEEQEKLNAEYNDKQAQQVDKYASALDRLRSVNEKLAENLDKRTNIQKWQDEITANDIQIQKNISEMERLQKDINRIQGSINAGIKVSENDKERLELYKQQKDALFDTNQALKTQNKLLEDNIANEKAEEAAKKAEEAAKKAKEAAEAQRKELTELEMAAQDALNAINPFISLVDKYKDKPLTIPIQVVEEDEVGEDLTTGDALLQRVRDTYAKYSTVTLEFKTQYQQTLHDLDLAERTHLITHEEYLKAKANADAEYSSKLNQTIMQQVSMYQQMATSIGSSLNNIADIYGEVNEKNGTVTDEVIKRQQDMQIAATVISTLGGIAGMTASIWTSPDTGEFWARLALQIAMTTEMLTAMGVNIAQIKNAKNGSASVSRVSTNGVSAIQAPITYTEDVNGLNISENMKDSRVYVLEKDITNTTNRVQVTSKESRF